MALQKDILLFGAGKSATVLIDYLIKTVQQNNWLLTVADNDYQLALSKINNADNTETIQASADDEAKRKELIQKADIVISMLPPALHYLIALDCIEYGKHLLTASYVDDKIKALQQQIESKGLLFLCEMGLDPGIDHMTAMQMIDNIHEQGGKIVSFKSHCGGLIAPESDDNPWRYKISWNPANIVAAGKAGADYKDNNNLIHLKYEDVFANPQLVEIPGLGNYAWYANRDSVSYMDLYKLHKTSTFIRTTLRHPDFFNGWKSIVDLHLTSTEDMYDTDGMSVADFFQQHFAKYNFDERLKELLQETLASSKSAVENMIDVLNEAGKKEKQNVLVVDNNGELTAMDADELAAQTTEVITDRMRQVNVLLKQLFYLGIQDEALINKGRLSAAQVLQFILEQKLALQPNDKDMIIMMHETEYELNGEMHQYKSWLVLKGDDALRTAMAKTVGLPLGIAARLILENKITTRGLHIPVSAEIYAPVLQELARQGIRFEESFF